MVALDPLWTMLFTLLFVVTAIAVSARASLAVAGLVASTPFALAHGLLGTTVTLPKVVLVGAIVGLAAQRGSLKILRARPIGAVLAAMTAVTVVVAATVAVAHYPGPAVRETFKWLQYGLVVAVAYVAYERDPDDRTIVWTWAAVTLLVTLLAIGQYAIGAPSGFAFAGTVVPRIAGPLEGPNQLAGYLEISLAVLCAWYRPSALLGAAIAIAACALALTFSRAGIFAAAIGVGIVVSLKGAQRRPLLTPLAIGAALGAVGAGTWMILARVPGALAQAPQMLSPGGVGYRRELWRAAIALWRQHPLLGVGAGNYELELASVGVQGVRTHANSWYLQSLAEGGIALFGATVALAATLLFTLGRKLSEAAPWQIAAFAASLALVAHQAVDYLVFYPKVALGWWILVGLGASALRRSLPKRS
jgi:O-antigen ligase